MPLLALIIFVHMSSIGPAPWWVWAIWGVGLLIKIVTEAVKNK